MIPRLNISFPIKRQWCYWFGKQCEPSRELPLNTNRDANRSCEFSQCSRSPQELEIIGDPENSENRVLMREYLLNHARTGIVMALHAAVPKGGRVGVVAYNCHTVANAVVNAGCVPFFVDVTGDLRIDIESVPVDLDAIVVTNLFGIRNDVGAIRKRCPRAVVIVDNAHGYGLPVEGDFTVYSINQGKFPALGPGGILVVNLKENENKENIEENNKNTLRDINKKEESQVTFSNSQSTAPYSAHMQASGQTNDQLLATDTDKSYLLDSSEKNDSILESTKNAKKFIEAIEEQYEQMPGYGFVGEVKLFAQIMVKAVAYSRLCYWLVMRMKKSANPDVHETVSMKRMAPGVSRLYNAALPEIPKMIEMQRHNAAQIAGAFYGDNAFMAIVKCDDPSALQKQYAARGIETATHFSRCITWAKQFGYVEGSCPNAEYLVNHLLMVPTYSN